MSPQDVQNPSSPIPKALTTVPTTTRDSSIDTDNESLPASPWRKAKTAAEAPNVSLSAWQSLQETGGEDSIPDPFEIPDRNWPVDKILESKVFDGERYFKVQWSEIELPRRSLHERGNGQLFVVIDRSPWEVESFVQVTYAPTPLCMVKWKATWKRERYLPNASELIADFDKWQGKCSVSEAAAPQHTTQSLTPKSEGSSSSSDLSEEATPSSRSPTNTALVIDKAKFVPREGFTYRGADFREALSRSKSRHLLKEWNANMDEGSLVFRPSYVAKGREFNLERADKARGILVHFSGVEQQRECECCQKDLGPFTKCVVSPLSNHGACANCQCNSNARHCNFHRFCRSVPVLFNAELTSSQLRTSVGRLLLNQCLRLHLRLRSESRPEMTLLRCFAENHPWNLITNIPEKLQEQASKTELDAFTICTVTDARRLPASKAPLLHLPRGR